MIYCVLDDLQYYVQIHKLIVITCHITVTIAIVFLTGVTCFNAMMSFIWHQKTEG